MATVYRPNGAASASDSQPSLNSFGSGSSSSTLYSSASCSSAGHYPACTRCESYPYRYEADCSPDGRRPLRRDTHVTSPPGQALRGRWEVDSSGTPPKSAPAQSHKALKVLCGKIVATLSGSVTLSPNAARLLSGPRTTTVSASGSVVEYSTGPGDADGKPLRFPDLVHVSPGEGSVRVLVGDEGLIRANGLVAGVLGAKQWAEDEMARRRSSSRRP
ncbi:hypothetical protein FS749_012024 [Ceratobasidium sp. UAMH 11750]|nr:hypothetical protein FS749_012024 [Ceratobasidium sp. UAMH 11750]